MGKRGPARNHIPRGSRPGHYCGIALCEWRGSVRALLASNWYLFADPSATSRTARIHAAVVLSAAYLLPVQWHREHTYRFKPDYYAQREAWLRTWKPLPHHHEGA